MPRRSQITLLLVLAAAACGPDDRNDNPGGVDAPVVTPDTPGTDCVPIPELCGDGIDNDCDGRTDCGDNDCSGIGGCPVCGTVENPQANPIALPDGVSSGQQCSTDAQCGDPSMPYCVFKECHDSYSSVLNFVGFPQNATLDDPSKLLNICATMEHSWLRDLQMEVITPDGRIIILHKFEDRSGNEVFLGVPNPSDNLVPGVGWKYCWTMNAATDMLRSPGAVAGTTVAAGDYKTITPWTVFQGTPLNGQWEFRVTDLWRIDDGFLFDWSISFDPSLVEDCEGPIIN